MRIGLLIGALVRGGAERQLAELAVGLRARGHEVEIAAYAGAGAFDEYVEARGVPVRRLGGGSKAAKLRAVKEWVAAFRPEVLHGAMKRAGTLAILASLPQRRCRLVTTDLSTASYSRHKPVLWIALAMYGLADAVTTQTEMNRLSLGRLAPWLRGKTRVIRNGVDLERFTAASRGPAGSPFRFVCVSRVYRVKNPVRIVAAAGILRERGVPPFRLDWYGRFEDESGRADPDYLEALALARRLKLDDVVTFHGEVGRVEDVYRDADALVLASVQEGIPNAVVEAMACGLPIVVSRISDLPLVVAEARNGFVCEPLSEASIADAMQQALALGAEERRGMSARSREVAVRWFGRDRYVLEYEALYQSLLAAR